MSAHLWYHTMFLFEEGVFIQPCSISYGITLWLKKNEQLFTSYYMLLAIFHYFYHCCIGYLSVLAWQAAEAAAGSPAQAS